ncbi:MAG: efflux RND transporter permease subunit [Alphaproteobacteria bacterium]|nr:efflux RND transporter permease subunit [Alphaproteobacteria bacterium]
MSFSSPFIRRPVATTLLTIAIALSGLIAFKLLPVASLPQVDYPTIMVQASMPGASPETMASSVATPLERHLGQIADVTEMTSQSTLGNSRITLQFGLDRNIDGAARDVQAAINAARADLPAALKSNPTYRKANPADPPIMNLALTSATMTPGQIYDSASSVLAQKLSQIQGVGQVSVGGSSLPAVRIELNPRALFKYGIGLEDVRAALSAANANSPKGALEERGQHFQIYTNDQARHAVDYRDMVIAWRNNAPVRLSDVGVVSDSVEDLRNQGLFNGKPAVILSINKQPGSNIVETVDRIKEILPQLQASIPAAVNMTIASDRTPTIRASLADVERTLMISTVLVIFVVFIFLRDGRAALIPSIAVPVSLIGTFGVMYLLHYSLDNFSLMAMTVATGFVVDDAIVVLENIARHIDNGMPRMKAALQGAREVTFTVISMSLSLIAVFLPILLMSGMLGRLFREFAMTLAISIVISLFVSLTATPMMSARLLSQHKHDEITKSSLLRILFRMTRAAYTLAQRQYDKGLMWSLRHKGLVILSLFITIGLNFYLFTIVPKGFLPQQDTGMMFGNIQADQSISFQSMRQKMQQIVEVIHTEPAVSNVAAFTGGNQTNQAFVFVSMKPLSQRTDTADMVLRNLRKKLKNVTGATLLMQPGQDVRVGGRASGSQYQYSIQSDDLDELRQWSPKITTALREDGRLLDVFSDQQDSGLETNVTVDRDSAARLNLQASQIDNTLYDAFGQRQVSVIYNPLNQYHVVMEVDPSFWQSPASLNEIYVSTAGNVSGTQSSGPAAGTTTLSNTSSVTISDDAARNQSLNAITAIGHNNASSGAALTTQQETMIPLPAISKVEDHTTPLGVNHQGHFAVTTISFNLPVGQALGYAVTVMNDVLRKIGVPASIHGSFQGTAQVFQDALKNQPVLIATAFITVYIVLGILYESVIHPLTILSTLPSAGVGAVIALLLCGMDFNIIALISLILLIGIVKKNAIMMIDFAIEAQRTQNLSARDAIYRACLLRFRPIMMTSLAALLGALPLAIGFGEGSELRRPLGISIVGGLLVSQFLTLFTTPVVYIYLDQLRTIFRKKSVQD